MNYKKRIIELLKLHLNMNEEVLSEFIDIPVVKSQGDYCVQCFKISKIIGKNPNIIAQELKESISCEVFEKVQNIGPYLNFFINRDLFVKEDIEIILNEKDKYGLSYENKDKVICIECINSNTRDIFKIENIFGAIFMFCLYKLLKSQGFTVMRINRIDDLNSEIDLNTINNIYNEIGIEFDSFESELLYENVKSNVFDILNKKNIIYEDCGISYVSLKKYNMAPYILSNDKKISKSLKRLLSVIYREEKYRYYKNIYINNYINSYNFKQLLGVLNEYDKSLSEKCAEVSYGIMKFFKNNNFYCNIGQITFLEFKNLIMIKLIENSDKNDIKSEILEKRAINIIIFSVLKQFRNSKMIFDFNSMSCINNDNFLYIEKVYNSAVNIINKNKIYVFFNENKHLCEKKIKLMEKLHNFNECIQISIEKLDLQYMIRYILDVSKYIYEIFIEDNRSKHMEIVDMKILMASIQVLKNACSIIGIEISR